MLLVRQQRNGKIVVLSQQTHDLVEVSPLVWRERLGINMLDKVESRIVIGTDW